MFLMQSLKQFSRDEDDFIYSERCMYPQRALLNASMNLAFTCSIDVLEEPSHESFSHSPALADMALRETAVALLGPLYLIHSIMGATYIQTSLHDDAFCTDPVVHSANSLSSEVPASVILCGYKSARSLSKEADPLTETVIPPLQTRLSLRGTPSL